MNFLTWIFNFNKSCFNIMQIMYILAGFHRNILKNYISVILSVITISCFEFLLNKI